MSASYLGFIGEYGRRMVRVTHTERESLKTLGRRRGRVGVSALLVPNGSRVTFFEAARREDWSALSERAGIERDDRAADLAKLVPHRAQVAGLVRDIPQLRLAGRRAVAPAARDDWQAGARAVRKAGRANDVPEARLRAGLQAIERFDPGEAAGALARNAQGAMTRVDRNGRRQLSGLAGARYAGVVASFNSLPRRPRARIASNTRIASVVAPVEKHVRELHAAFRTGSGLAVRAESADLERVAGKVVDQLVPLLAAIADRRQTAPHDARLGAIGLAGSDAMADALRAQALATLASWVVGWEDAGGTWDTWRAAATLPFSRSTRAARLVPIEALASNPTARDGRLTRIEGVVESVEIRHKDAGRKVISTVHMVDAAGHRVSATLPFVKADSGGLVPGCWGELTGIWRTSSKDVLGDPALELDVVAYAERGKRAWSDWVRSQLAPVLWVPAHALNGRWTWERGTDGAANPVRYGVWSRPEGRRRNG